jgi:acetyl-CoA carboxylase biotin carboxylase subunit
MDFDLIKEQILLAAGEKISGAKYFPEKMHAIECRVNAEDPFNNFSPSPGKITALHTPKGYGVRVDTHVYAGYTIPPYYDSLLAKVICRAKTREETIVKMKRAMQEFIIEGVKTTIPFHIALMDNEAFRKGQYDTGLLERFDYVSAMKEIQTIH